MSMLEIKNAPAIAGLRFRAYQGESDHAGIAAVLCASQAADNVERSLGAADITNAYRHLSNCDPYKDMIIAEVDGNIIGYARGWWENDTDSGRLYHHNGFLLSAWRRKGIGRAMLVWMESRLAELAHSHPGTPASLQVSATQYQPGAEIMLQRAGYQPARHFYEMLRPSLEGIIEFPLPAGLEIRPVRPEHYPALWNSVVETSRDEWGYTEPADGDYEEWLASPHFQPHLWQVAWDVETEKIVGHALTFIDEEENQQLDQKRGYTEGIGVDQAWRRRGIARALISRSLQAQKAAGMTKSALAADSDSTSHVLRLYQSCGFEIVNRDTIFKKPIHPLDQTKH